MMKLTFKSAGSTLVSTMMAMGIAGMGLSYFMRFEQIGRRQMNVSQLKYDMDGLFSDMRSVFSQSRQACQYTILAGGPGPVDVQTLEDNDNDISIIDKNNRVRFREGQVYGLANTLISSIKIREVEQSPPESECYGDCLMTFAIRVTLLKTLSGGTLITQERNLYMTGTAVSYDSTSITACDFRQPRSTAFWQEDNDPFYPPSDKAIASPSLIRFSEGIHALPDTSIVLDQRGSHSVDLQTSRNTTDLVEGRGQTASGDFASVLGGSQNLSAGDWSTTHGGLKNSAIGNYSVVLGGSNHSSAGDYSSVLGGNLNLTYAPYGSILSGWTNTIDTAASYSSIIGGHFGRLSSPFTLLGTTLSGQIQADNPYSFILGGGTNSISNSSKGHRHILNGTFNQLTTSDANDGYQSILSGEQNVIEGASGEYNTVIGGVDNRNDRSTYGTILAGTNNINQQGSYKTILSGQSNSIVENTLYSSIGNGLNNYIRGSYNLIGNGTNNSINTSRTVIASGVDNKARYGSYHFIGGGNNNSIIPPLGLFTKHYNAIVTGSFNEILSSGTSFIGTASAGKVNRDNNFIATGLNVVNDGELAAILTGEGVTIASNNFNSIAVNGQNNNITSNSWRSAILGGENNVIDADSKDAAVLGGRQNNAEGELSATIGGEGLKAYGTGHSVMGSYNDSIAQSGSKTDITHSDNIVFEVGVGASDASRASGLYVRNSTWAGAPAQKVNWPYTSRIINGQLILSLNGLGQNNWSIPTGDVDIASEVSVAGTCTATDLDPSVIPPSDARLKDIIESLPLKQTLKKVAQLKPIRYRFRKGARAQLGMSAQNVQKHFPDLVYTMKNNQLGLNYSGLIAPVVASLQAIDQKIGSEGQKELDEKYAQLVRELKQLQREENE